MFKNNRYNHSYVRAGRYAVRSIAVLFLLSTLFYGCAVVKKPPLEDDSFFIHRANIIRESGDAAYDEGDFLKALVMYRDAYAIDRSKGEAASRLSDLIGMGKAYTQLGKNKKARHYLTKAVEAAFSARDERGLAGAYAALAEFYLKTARPDLALSNINDAMRLSRSGGIFSAQMLNLAALIYVEAGRLDEADAVINQSITLLEGESVRDGPSSPKYKKPSVLLADAYRIKALILARGSRVNDAMVYYSKAYDIDTRLGNDRKRALDLWGYGELLFNAGRYGEAATWLKRSYRLNIKGGFFDAAIKDLDKLVEVYIALGDKRSESYYRNMRSAVLSDIR